MIINGMGLFKAGPIKDMERTKKKAHGLSYGLSEVGYDIRTKQEIIFTPPQMHKLDMGLVDVCGYRQKMAYGTTRVGDLVTFGRTALASTVEEFNMPCNLWGEMRNKSTMARRFVDASIGTDIEPGWCGFLTLEIIFHGMEPVIIPAGSPIAKVVFHEICERAAYDGKYQNQADKPVEARLV